MSDGMKKESQNLEAKTYLCSLTSSNPVFSSWQGSTEQIFLPNHTPWSVSDSSTISFWEASCTIREPVPCLDVRVLEELESN